jgi:hypothetical protein
MTNGAAASIYINGWKRFKERLVLSRASAREYDLPVYDATIAYERAVTAAGFNGRAAAKVHAKRIR